MKQNWDVIIIGAGIGGLIAAGHLVRAGLRVLVLERNPHIGGTSYVYHRKDFSFPMGPLGFSHPKLVRNALADLGVGENLKFSRVHYRLRAFGLDLPLSLPYRELIETFKKSFPADAEAVEHFFNLMDDLKLAKGTADSNLLGSLPPPSVSAKDYLNVRIKDSRLRCILGTIGTREPYSGLPLLAAMWNLMVHEGIWFPEEGVQSFCKRLASAVVGKGSGGSEVRLNQEVSKIRVHQGKVQGVSLGDGTEMDSPFIISNADFKTTFLRLIGPESVPTEWREAVSRARQTGSVFQVCLGVDGRQANLSAFKEASRIIYRRNTTIDQMKAIDWRAMQIAPDAFAGQELEVSLWGKDWEEISRERKLTIVIRAEAEYKHFARFRLGWRQRSQEYHGYKARLGEALIQEVSHLIPGLEEAILTIDIATPLTFEDQGGRSEGAVAGWSWDYEDFRDRSAKELIRTPIRGLYMAGYQAFSALFMGGVPTAMESGKRAAQAVLRGTDPVETISIPVKP